MRRAAEGSRATSGVYAPMRIQFAVPRNNRRVGGRIAAHQRLIVAIKGALHHGIKIGIAAAEEEVFADAALDGRLDALCTEGSGVDIEAGVVLKVGAEVGN